MNGQTSHPQTRDVRKTYAGIHLSGSNSHKTSIVVVEAQSLLKPMNIAGLYEKIGSRGKLFSDERLVDILKLEGPFAEVFVDCPLSVPPCVACVRAVCPGVVNCEDLSVAYMMALTHKVKAMGLRKKRPINPQSQRLWDVIQQFNPIDPNLPAMAPSFSANLVPLVVRARTLQRRLYAAIPNLILKETSLPHAILALCSYLGMDQAFSQQFRNFEDGRSVREEIFNKLVQQKWIEASTDAETRRSIVGSVECFHAFICAFVAVLCDSKLCAERPQNFLPEEGWVYLPKFTSDIPQNGGLDLPLDEYEGELPMQLLS
jgi:hypothetical protein